MPRKAGTHTRNEAILTVMMPVNAMRIPMVQSTRMAAVKSGAWDTRTNVVPET